MISVKAVEEKFLSAKDDLHDIESIQNVSDVLYKIRGTQKYQKWFSFLLIMIFTSGNRFMTLFPFLQLYPGLKCADSSGAYTLDCTQAQACVNASGHAYQVDPDSPVTLNNWMTNLDLICTEKYIIGLQGITLFMGQAIGALTLAHLTDSYGRKKMTIFHGGVFAALIMLSTLSPNITWTYISLFFIGLLFVPRSATTFTYMQEINPDCNHELTTLYNYIGDGVTFVISGLFLKYFRDVFLFLDILGIIIIVCVVVLTFYLPESSRYLYSRRRYDEMEANFSLKMQWNGIPDPDGSLAKKYRNRLEDLKRDVKQTKNSCFGDLLIIYNSPDHFKSMIAVVMIWIYAAFNYYLIGYYVKYFPGDIFTNFLMMTGAEIVSPIVLYFFQRKFIVKYTSRYILIGCSIFAAGYILNDLWGSITYVPFLILGIRIFVKGAYILGYYANGKLFPTLVKSSIFSLTNGIGRPFSGLSTMVTEYTKSPGQIFLVTSLVMLGFTTLFPNSDITEQEIEKISKKKEGKVVKQ